MNSPVFHKSCRDSRQNHPRQTNPQNNPLKFNSSPRENGGWKTIFLLGRELFWGYVKLRGLIHSRIIHRTYRIHVWYVYLHEWLMFMVNVGKYSVHGSYGKEYSKKNHNNPHKNPRVPLQEIASRPY